MLDEIKALIREAAAHAETEKFVPNELIVPALLLEQSEQISALEQFVRKKAIDASIDSIAFGDMLERIRKMLSTDVKPAELRRLQEDQHTGIMIAFFLDPETARQLVILGGEAPDDLHITLAYLGDMADFTSGDIARIEEIVATFASEDLITLSGSIGGIGRFTPSDSSDGLAPIVALVNVASLQAHRQVLVDLLNDASIDIANDFDFLPHITLAYVDPGAPMPIQNIEALPLTFDTLWLCIGDDRIAYKLGPPPTFADQPYNYQIEMQDKDGYPVDLSYGELRKWVHKEIERAEEATPTPETIGDPLDWSDDDLDKLSQIGDDDIKAAVQLWDDNAPEGFAGMLNAEAEK